jgi:hypothetical protein
MNKLITPPAQAPQSSRPIRSPLSVSEARPLPDISNGSAVKSAKNGPENHNKINGKKILISGAQSSPPLNLLGGGSHRFEGAWTGTRRSQAAAAIDTELGVPVTGDPIISSDGVLTYRVPRRRS